MQRSKIIIDTSSWINVFRLRKVLKEEVIDKAKEVLKDAGNKAKRRI